MLKGVTLMQVLDARSRQSIPNVMRWYNTILSHPTISEFTGTPSSPPLTSSASSSAASHSQTNGVLEEKSKATAASGSQTAHTPNQQVGEQQTSSGEGQQEKASGTGDGQQDKLKGKGEGRQDKPKGKDAKGGKLAKNDVAKGQKKGGDKKEKTSQAPKGIHPSPALYPPLAILYPPLATIVSTAVKACVVCSAFSSNIAVNLTSCQSVLLTLLPICCQIQLPVPRHHCCLSCQLGLG